MTIKLKGLVSGTHKGQPVAFSTTFPNVQPDDAAQAAYEHVNIGKKLKLRRLDWHFAQIAPKTYSLRWFDRAGKIEGDLTICIVGRADA